MTTALARTLHWAPRVLGILFAAFISIFALDVFGEARGLGATLLALALHLIPTVLVVLMLVLAWRWPWVGAVAFIALGLVYAVWARQHLLWILLVGGPLFLIGALFLADWLLRRGDLRPA